MANNRCNKCRQPRACSQPNCPMWKVIAAKIKDDERMQFKRDLLPDHRES